MKALRCALARFGADTGGATVVIFAIALVPLIAVMGAAIDYTGAARLHDRLQVATDATALALCKANASLTATDLQVLARDMLAAELGSTRAELDVPQLRWVIAAQHGKAPWGNVGPVNDALEELARTDAGIVVVDTSRLPYLRAHYGTEGALRLGELMAEAFPDR
jgi:hypothetical protein